MKHYESRDSIGPLNYNNESSTSVRTLAISAITGPSTSVAYMIIVYQRNNDHLLTFSLSDREDHWRCRAKATQGGYERTWFHGSHLSYRNATLFNSLMVTRTDQYQIL